MGNLLTENSCLWTKQLKSLNELIHFIGFKFTESRI